MKNLNKSPQIEIKHRILISETTQIPTQNKKNDSNTGKQNEFIISLLGILLR